MAGWLVTFYGSNTSVAGGFPLKTVVTALSDIVSYAVTIHGAWEHPQNEGEVREYGDGTMRKYAKNRENFTFKLKPSFYPGATTTIQSFFPIALLNKNNTWVDWGTYKLYDSAYTSAKVQAIVFDGDYNIDNQDGWVILELPAKAKTIL